VPKAYQYDAALVEAARAAVNQGLDDVVEAGATATTNINTLGDKILAQMKHGYGYPFTAATAAAMADTTKIYVYTGSETGYTNGNWYYWNGTAWVSGGVYNATALETDKTLTVNGAAADAEVTGNITRIAYLGLGSSNNVSIKYLRNTQLQFINPTFIYFGNTTNTYPPTNVTLPANYENAWKIVYNISTQETRAIEWSSALNDVNDYLLGYVWKDYVHINGVESSFINMGYSPAFYCPYRGNAQWDATTRTLSITDGWIVSASGKKFSLNAQTLTATALEEETNSYNVYFDSFSSSLEVDSFRYNAPASYLLLGHISDNKLHLNGVDESYIYQTKVGFVCALPSSPWVYDISTRRIKVTGGYIHLNTGEYRSVDAQTLDLTTVPTTANAWQLYYDFSTGNVVARKWSLSISDEPNLAAIGHVWEDYIYVNGLDKNSLKVNSTTVAFLGDSITAGVGLSGSNQAYHMLFASRGAATALNYGVGSSGFVVNASGTVCVGNGTEGLGTYMTAPANNRISDILSTIDTTTIKNFVIAAGTNDWSSGIDIDTFTSAVNSVIDTLYSAGASFVFMTPIRRIGDTTNNGVGKTLKDYRDAIINICEDRGVPYVDMYSNLGLNPNAEANKNAYVPDGIHPNQAGQLKMYFAVKSRLEHTFISYVLQ
jgi:lysophospholipase L1-like esterase